MIILPKSYVFWDITPSRCNCEDITLHNHRCDSPSIIRIIKSRRMRWTGHVARIGEKRSAYRILEGKPEGKKPLRRPRRRWGIILEWILER
jgi:hypothetical protein